MAERIYTVTVASGNLYGGGTGSVYYLDGARNSTGPGTVEWVAGATLRFDQSAGSNDNHPLIFSTNTSTSGIISSGVTYYLDGSSNQSDYVNTTTFNAATTRYVEITPSSQTDFYYLCYIHGVGMGGIFDITQSTWGALTWSQGNWSAQNNQTVLVTGIAATPSVGNETIELNTFEPVTGIASLLSVGSTSIDLLNNGWGANTWGFSEWGQVGNLVTGQALTTAIGSGIASIDFSISVSGQSLTSAIGNETITINQTVAATGQALNASVGILDPVPIIVGQSLTSSVGAVQATGVIEVGWGGDSWGQNQWGELNAPTETVTTAGLLQTAAGAIASITANADVAVSGIAATLSIGDDISGTSHTQAVTSAGLLQMSSESSVIDIGVPVTGIQTTINTAGENLVVNSVDLDSSFPNQFRATVTSNAALSPFGTKDATTLTGNGSDTGTKVLFKFGFNTPSPGDIQTFSIFAKNSAGGTGGTFQMEIGNSSQRALAQFNITNGIRVGTAQSSEVSFVEGDSVNYGDGWYRFRLTVQYESGFNKPNTNVGLQLNGTDANDPGVILFGAQVEEQTALTNYKPTFGTAVSSVVSIDDTTLTGIGWGRDTWGNQAWNVNYSVLLSGQALASSIGNEEAGTDSQPTITGQQASLTFGAFSIKVDQDISLTVSEHTMNSSLGSPSLVQSTNESITGQSLSTSVGQTEAFQNTPVDVSGISMSISLGNEGLVQSTTEVVSGQALATSIGTPTEIPAQNVGVTGLSLTTAMGEETTVSNANVALTGIVLTSSAGSTNITAWQEVDLGVNNTWTEVDLAA